MKKIQIILYNLILLVMLASCQIIKEEDRLIPIDAGEPVSSSLIVEFTGFLCVNCPNAAEQAHALLGTYPDNLVVVEMHPATNAFCQTNKAEYDYTCPEADVYYTRLGGTSSTGFPTGVVDMTSGLQDYTAWPALVTSSVMKEKIGRVNLSVMEEGRELTVHYAVRAESKDSTRTGERTEMQLLLWLVEDSIVGPQMMPDGSTNMAYVHNHVLRGSLFEDPWGKTVECQVNTMMLGQQSLVYTVPDSINGQAIRMEHCSVVGVLLDPSSHALMGVERQKVLNPKGVRSLRVEN